MKKVFLLLTMFLFAFTGVTRANVQQNRDDQVIEQGFEDGLGDWTMNHCHSSSGPTSSYGGNTGNYAFRFYYTANYPQYLISPELDDNDGVNFTFYAARYSSNYPETFKVGYSSTTNDPTEFTWGSEVTCTTMYGAGAYQEYSYDFPAGTKYVSIACTSNDQFYLFIDDITVTATEPAPAPTPGETVEVTIGDPTSTDVSSYIPGYTLYDYAISQQIYTADEIGVAGTIETLTMWLKNNSSYARNINVYMTEVEATEFASTTDWVSMSADDMVASFTIENAYNAPIEFAIPLNTPFEYSGTGNLVICFQDVTGSWSSGLGGVVMDAAGNQAIYAYRDGTVYDPSNPGVNGTLLAKKNVIKLSITTGGGGTSTFATVPEVLDLGYRPNGAWMAPYVFNMKSNVGAVTVNALDFSGNYFTYNAELPATVSGNKPLEVAVSTGTADEGEVNSTITVLYSGNNRDAEQLNIKATAYNPVDGDVYENAVNVTSFPYAGNAPAGIYKNYELPEATEGADAVYKMTFANDVMLTAGTTGADGVAALYTEDFAGEGGPMADNNYVYNGPTVNPGPVNMWFNYAYTGSNTWYGTSAGGGTMWGYRITPDMLQDLGLGEASVVTVESAARNSTIATYYDLVIMKGGDTPNIANMVYYQENEDFTPGNYFEINLDTPQALGDDENIWIILYSDSEYAAYVGRYPVDATNGQIWYTTNGESWYSNSTYAPVIYTHFLTIDGREVVVDLANMKIRESNPANGQIGEAEGEAMGVSKAQIAQNSGKRDVIDNNIEDLYVKAGTYYLVIASTDAEFPVSIETAEVPAPEQAIVYAPMDGETNVESSVDDPYVAQWVIGEYTEEMQVLFGTQYPPQTALIDWTTELVAGVFLPELEPNQSYFMQVNERNAAGTTMGEIIAFTTPISAVEEVVVTNPELYPGDAAMLTWTAPERSFKGYNIYQDGVKINESLVTTAEYAVEDLPYNMDGYVFQVSAVFDAGESLLSAPDTAYMTGFGSVNGYVYDTDTLHPIANATMVVVGIDEYGAIQEYEFLTDETGFYEGEVLAGLYAVGILTEGYATAATVIYVAYDQLTGVEDIITHEFYYPLGQITATEEESDVLVEWSWDPAEMIVDFETGDFSQAEFTLPAQYPWAITTTNPYEGTYCMKSTCEGVASGVSSIEATVDVPFEEAKMGFYVRVSSETNYDKFHFYIDGVEKGSALSGELPYAYKEFSVTGGTHTYKWEYAKDGSVNANDDCIYVDNITMFRKVEPTPPPAPGDVTVILTAPDVWGDGSGYQMLLDETHSLYGTTIPETGALSMNCSGNEGIYDQFSHKIPTNADGNCSTQNMVNNASVTITIPSGIYDWCITNPTPGDRIWIAAANGNVGGRQDDYVFEAGNTYEFVVSTYGSNDGVDVTITGGAKNTANASESDNAYANIDCKVADPAMLANRVEAPIKKIDMRSELNSRSIDLNGGNREFVSYNLYRRNNIDEESVENPTLLAQGIAGDVYEYLDTEWPALPYGEWQWGIAATYEGYAPVPDRNREVYTYTFDSGLEGWTNIDADGDGNVWYNSANSITYSCYDYSTLGHNGTGCFMISQSYTDCTYDSYDANNFLVSPQKYPIDANSSITFWQDWANDAYPDFYEVMVSTAANPGASDFTTVWSVGSKSHGNGAKIRNINNRYENWTEYTVSLAAYAGQEVWIAFHHEDYDNYELWLDDVTITAAGSAPVPPTPGPTGDGISEILWSNVIDKDMIATLTVNVALNNGQSPAGAVVELEAADREYEFTIDETGTITEEIRKGEYLVEIELDGYIDIIDLLVADEDEISLTYVLQEVITPVDGLYVSPTGWAMWEGGSVGPTPGPTGDDSFEESFEGGLNGWNVLTVNTDGGEWLHSSQNLGGHDYTGLAHTGTGFAMCYSFVDYVGAFNTDSYMYTPQKYDIVNGSTLTFFADNANDTYPENFSVVIATVDNPTAADFTQIWNGGAKGTGSDGAIVRHNDTRYENWRQHTIDLSAYAGQSVYIGFHDVNYDMYEIWIDDVTLSTGAKADRAALSYKLMLDGEYVGETYYPFAQLPVEGMTEGSQHVAAVAPLYASGMGEWSEYTFTYNPCDNFDGTTSFNASVNNADVTLTWTLPNGPTPPTPPTPGEGQWYYYDNGTNEDAIGTGGGNFYWGVMFPAGSYEGNAVTKVSTYDYMAMTGNVTIYNDGTTAPATAVGTADVTLTGSEEFVEVEFATPVTIDPSKNLWIIYYNGSGATYPAAVCANTGDPNGRWVSTDGTDWMDLATAGLDNTFMVRAYVATANKGEVVEISAPQGNGSNGTLAKAGVAKANRGNRAAWDLVASFTGSSAGQQAVATDGNYIYTASWQSAPTGGYTFYQYNLDGTFVEGFDIAGATGIRDLTTDGQYFYGSSGGAQIFCMDFTTRTLVSTINCSGLTSRHVAYDPVRDGFWAGNWTTLALYSRTGALIQNGPAPTSAYGSSYYVDADGVEHIYLFCQISPDGSGETTNRVEVIDYNITTNTLVSDPVHVCNDMPGYNAADGIAGGCFIGTYNNKTCFFANVQQSPNVVGIYDLEAGPVPPTPPTEGILGVILYRNDEFVGIFDANTTTFVDEGLESGHYDYTIRVIYGGEYDVTYYAMSCGDEAEVEVIIGVTENDEVVNSIYPNPTSGDLYINATAMKHVTVFNAMGQMVLDQEVSGDSMVLNMGQLESGVYMVKVTTETGSNVKRINVVK